MNLAACAVSPESQRAGPAGTLRENHNEADLPEG